MRFLFLGFDVAGESRLLRSGLFIFMGRFGERRGTGLKAGMVGDGE